MADTPTYWFPAKRYGWGWGLPSAWQGWVVLGLFIAMLGLGAVLWPPRHDRLPFMAWTGVLVLLLMACCWLKGEPPGWRWGSR